MTAFLKQLMNVPVTATRPAPRTTAALRAELHEASTCKQDLLNRWAKGTLRQRRAIYKRYLHGVDVVRTEKTTDQDQESIILNRLKPRWKTPEEIGT